MAKFLSGRHSNLNLGITSVTESSTVLQTIGKVGIGTSATENYGLHIAGIDNGVVRDNSLYVSGNEWVTGNLHVDDTVYVAGITTVESTLLVGGATSTGTFNQTLQVDGGAYISTYVSIGYTNPFANLTVFDQSGPWIALVDPGQSSSAFEDNAGNLYIRSESGSGTAGEIIFQTGTANYQLRPSESGSNRMRIDTDGDVLINNDSSTGTLGSKLQVFGGAYVANNLGLGNTNPFYKLEVIGNTVITGFTSVRNQVDIGTNLHVVGISTFVSDVDINGGLDVDGYTELDNTNVSGFLTAYNLDVTNDFDIYAPDSVFYGNVTIQGDISIGGTSILLNAEQVRIEDKEIVLGFTTTVTPTDNTANSAGIAVASTEGNYLVPLQVVGINSLPNTYKQWLWYKHNTMGAGTTDAWLSNQAVGIGSTLVPNDIRLAVGLVKIGDNSITVGNIAGAAATITRGNFEILDAKTSYIDVGFATHLQGTSLNYTGISTISDIRSNTIQATGIVTTYELDVDGQSELRALNVVGVSTFSGIGTFLSDLYVGGDLYVADDLVFDEFTARNATLSGNVSADTLIVTGVSTFTNGPVLVGTGTSTGTSGQAFQVESGAYFAGPVGVASTDPQYDLDVNGDINFNGDLYKDGILFVAGVGIGSTEVNPQSGTITPEARVGTGFTDINFVGTGLSITGYGSTVVIDLDSVGGARVSVSTEPPGGARAGDLWWESDTGDLKVYYADGDSSQWVDTNGGENLAIIGEFPPASPLAGDLWWDSVYGSLKIYYDDGDSQQWVDTSNSSFIQHWFSARSGPIGVVTTYNVGIGTTVAYERLEVHGTISIDSRVSYGTTTAQTSSTSQIGIHSAFPVTSYRSVEYTIQATEGSSYHSTKILALHDGSSAYHTEYASIYNASSVATYDVDVSGGNLRLLATPASSGITTYNIIFDAIKV